MLLEFQQRHCTVKPDASLSTTLAKMLLPPPIGKGACIRKTTSLIADAFFKAECLLRRKCRPEEQKTYQVAKQVLPSAEASSSAPQLHVAAE